MFSSQLNLLISCSLVFSYLYSCFCLISLSVGAIVTFFILTGALFIGICTLRIRRAETSSVERILGPLWGAFKAGNTLDDSPKNLKIVAHRACGIDAPENSISALLKIVKEGIKAVEFDVVLTSDNVPVIFHDSSLSRMADVSSSVSSFALKELQDVDISVKHAFGKDFPGEKIPTLKSFIECCLENDVTMLIDLKDPKLVSAIVEAFKEHPRLVDMALVSSFNPLLIYQIRAADPRITGCLAWRPYYYSHEEYTGEGGPQRPRSANPAVRWYHRLLDKLHGWLLSHFLHHLLGLSALLLHKDMISRDVIEHWKKRGVRVLAWTVNSPPEKAFFERCLKIPYLTDTVIAS